MEGEITVTDKEGGIVLVVNIWAMVFICSFCDRFSIPAKNIRVFIDDMEIRKPKAFEEE